jgi:uncharacterized OB-fold protein
MAVSKIWRKIPENYNLIGNKCKKCSSLIFPARDVCKNCSSIELENYKFIGKGEIVTFTIIRTPVHDPEGENIDIAARTIPYILAIIKLAEGPLLTTQIVDCEINEVEIDKEVEVVFRKIVEKGKKGVIQYGYKFKLVR